jgi:hypothetical protein
VATLVPDNAQLARLFEGFLQVRVVAGVGNATAQQIPTLRPDWLEPFVDVDTLAVRAQDLLTDDSMTDAQRRAVEQFIKEYRGEVSDRD